MEKLASDLLLKSFSLWQQVLRGVQRVCDGKKTRSKMKRLLASAVTGSGYRIRVFKSLREHGLFAAIFVGWGEPSSGLCWQISFCASISKFLFLEMSVLLLFYNSTTFFDLLMLCGYLKGFFPYADFLDCLSRPYFSLRCSSVTQNPGVLKTIAN